MKILRKMNLIVETIINQLYHVLKKKIRIINNIINNMDEQQSSEEDLDEKFNSISNKKLLIIN